MHEKLEQIVLGFCEFQSANRAFASHMQILRERLRVCYIKEGVNHIQNCKQVGLLGCGNSAGSTDMLPVPD